MLQIQNPGSGSGSATTTAAAVIRHADQSETVYRGASTSANDIGTAIQTAFAALQAGESIEIGPVAANISSAMTIPANATVVLNGSQLTNTVNNLVMFTATSANWSLIGYGNASLIGLSGGGAGNETGLSITPANSGNTWKVSGLNFTGWNGIGISFTANLSQTDHGTGILSNLSFVNIGGTAINIPEKVEYLLFSDVAISGGGTGIACAGGNNQFIGGRITDTVTCGFDLATGNNDAHGSVSSFLFNHNSSFAVRLRQTANSFQFVNCDFFSNGTGTNKISIEGCTPVQFIGGILASELTFASTPTGTITFLIMRVQTSQSGFLTYTDYQRGFVKFYQCFTLTGPLTGYPLGNDGIDPTMGGTGSNAALAAGSIPYALTSGVLGQDTGFTRDATGTTTIKGPLTISTTDPAGATGSLILTAGDNTQVPAIVRGKADTVSPVVYPLTVSPTLWIAADRLAYAPFAQVTTITDLSGNGRNFTGPNGGSQVYPTLIPAALNGLPVLRATGVAFQFMDTASFSLVQPFYVIAVFKKATATNKVLFGGKTSGNAMLYSFAASSAKMNAGSDATVTCTPTNWNIGVFRYDGASSSYRINTGGAATTVSPGVSGIVGGFRLFDFNSGSGFPYDGDLAELILVPTANATTAQVEGLVQYCSNKWAVSLGAQGTSGASTVQTGDLAQWQLPAGGVLLKVDANGRMCKGAGATAPGIAAGAGAGTGPTVSVSGTDQNGQISVLTGSSPTASAVVGTITFANAWGTTPRVLLTPANAAAAALSGNAAVFVSSPGTTNFAVSVGSTQLGATTTYLWNYFVVG
jgi:hypothetical protein